MRKVGLVFVLLAAVGTLVHAQMGVYDIDYNIMGTGARARGMGGAFIGVADDATAVGWNPAGLAQLDKPEASVVGLFNMKKFTGEGAMTFPDYPEWNETYDWDLSVSHIAPAFASFIIPTKVAANNLVFAIAYQRMIDMGSGEEGDGEYEGFTDTLRYKYEAKTTGGIDAISPALAIQLNPQIMVGAAANILINGYKYEYTENFTDYPSATHEYSTESKLSGLNMNLGFLGTFSKMNIGAMFRLPFTFTEEPSASENWDLTGTGWTLDGLTTGSISESYSDVEVTMPFMFGFGVALKPTDKLTLAADFERRAYSSSEYTSEGYTVDAGLKDCNQFRVGMEYIITGNTGVFPIRLGFRTDPRVYTGSYDDGTDTSQVVGKVFTGGFGLLMGKVMFDLAYEYTMANHEDVKYNDPDGFYSYTGKVDEKSHNIMASAIIHF
ncbi:MAG: hypothetical protein Q7U71_05980 [bacterium]|nr:hypothetical protein [bacterium]